MAAPKCKEPGHLRVVLKRDRAALTTATLTEIDVLECRNDLGYHGWGAVLQPSGRAAGMHLLPESVRMLSVALPTVVAQCRRKPSGRGWAVAVEHTVKGELAVWRAFVPDLAESIGAQCAALDAAHRAA